MLIMSSLAVVALPVDEKLQKDSVLDHQTFFYHFICSLYCVKILMIIFMSKRQRSLV